MLVAEEVAGGYGSSTVVDGISLRVDRGEVVGLLGPNGHGKTTVARLLSGVLPLRGGRIHLNDDDVTGAQCHVIAQRGLTHVPQGDLLFGDMTVVENLRMGAFLRSRWSRRAELVDRAFSLFPRLHERRDSIARTLSGGERRMLAIGRGLMAGGTVLVVDEPALGLSPLMVETIYDALRNLRDDNTCLLIIEETPGRLEHIADRLYLLDGGRMVAEGPTGEILADQALLATYLGVPNDGEAS
ncbi:MAG: ABC transporter ATP-binding protein [Solirubrobacterales bacterium]